MDARSCTKWRKGCLCRHASILFSLRSGHTIPTWMDVAKLVPNCRLIFLNRPVHVGDRDSPAPDPINWLTGLFYLTNIRVTSGHWCVRPGYRFVVELSPQLHRVPSISDRLRQIATKLKVDLLGLLVLLDRVPAKIYKPPLSPFPLFISSLLIKHHTRFQIIN